MRVVILLVVVLFSTQTHAKVTTDQIGKKVANSMSAVGVGLKKINSLSCKKLDNLGAIAHNVWAPLKDGHYRDIFDDYSHEQLIKISKGAFFKFLKRFKDKCPGKPIRIQYVAIKHAASPKPIIEKPRKKISLAIRCHDGKKVKNVKQCKDKPGNSYEPKNSKKQTSAPVGYDGDWYISLTAINGCRFSGFKGRISIQNGEVSWPELNRSGRVFKSGRIRIKGQCRSGDCEVYFKGKMNSSSGEGTYETDIGNCNGDFTLTKLD